MKATKNMIGNLSRLKNQAAFDSLRKTKTRWVSQGFAIQAIPQQNPKTPPIPAFCVITSKKTAKLASDRNKMRRRLRAVAYEILSTQAKQDMEYMLVARAPSQARPMDDLRKDLLWCLKKLDLLHHDN
jgi:ribonuclease P protein component